jgi:peptide/nickel transport system substrate-binding protein
VSHPASSRAAWRRVIAVLVAAAFLATACGGSKSNSAQSSGSGASAGGGAEGKPVTGGSLVYGLEAETTGGFCPQEAQLAISGIMVARTIYDTLTAPDDKGDYKPYLAKSVTPNATYDSWTIVLRDGVTFHDGTALDATVVKNNLDGYRGTYPNRKPLLFKFVFENIADVSVSDPKTVVIKTKTPWPALPAYLFSSGRLGMAAQAQLDDTSTCSSKLIGTGPFKLKEWVQNDHLTAVKNAAYWQKDADGVQLPYLDQIEFRPIPEATQRLSALETGQIQAMHTDAPQIITKVREDRDAGKINEIESDKFTELGYWLLNSAKPPFDNQLARDAITLAFDREKFNTIQNNGIPTIASGPFAPGNVGNLDDSGFPKFSLAAAQAKVKEYEAATGQKLSFTIKTTTDSNTVAGAQLYQTMLKDAGIEVSLGQVEQSQLIGTAIGSDWQMLSWRNHPGGDPDTQYVWWHSGSLVNFGKIADPELDKLLDDGRKTIDPAQRKAIYENVNKLFAKKLYNVWEAYSMWTVASGTKVHGIFGPDLPDAGGKPWPSLATGHPVVGLWVEK